jgi:branched-chain amino acid transport system substrate-binding protein
MAVHRRRVLKGLGAAGAAVATMRAPYVAAQAPFKLGLLTVKTGPLAQGGIQMEQGILTFLKEKGNTLAGRKIEFISADTGGNPAGARTKAQELIERDKVNIILGPLAAFELLAITNYVRDNATPLMSIAAAEDVTQRQANPFVIRPSATSAQCCHVMGDYAAKELKFRRAALISEDFAFGYEQMAGFQRVFEDNGGKIVQKIWTPINATDYAPYLSQIKQDVDGIFLGSAGSNSLRFLRQRAEYGLKIPIVGAQTVSDEAILRNMGDEALGVITTRWYSATIDTPANKKFVADYVKANGYEPGTFAAGGYSGGVFLEQGLIDAKGDVENKEQFMRHLRTMKITGDPRGSLRFDEYGNPIETMFITKVERVGGKLMNTVIATYPETSQFWTYDPKEFLSKPVYSRNSPPARYLE